MLPALNPTTVDVSRRLRRLLFGLLLGLAAAGAAGLAAAQAASGDRIALVVGNAAYLDNPLPNPKNDAAAVAELLRRAGFVVDLQTDTSRQQLLQAIGRFGDTLRDPRFHIAVFYYAGHGFQQDWRNYLVPVDARVRSAADVARQTVDVSELLRRMSSVSGRNHLVILDACRDDPFAGAYRPALKGLSQFDAPAGSLLAYATAPGRTAFDGRSGSNGLYTSHLVRELGAPESSVEDAFKRVRLNVRLESRGRQIPWEMGSLEENVYLFPQARRQTRLSDAELEARFDRELAAWMQVRQSDSVAQLAEFIRKFPSGNTSELAQARLNRLLAEEVLKAGAALQAEARQREADALAERMKAEADARPPTAAMAPPRPPAGPAGAAPAGPPEESAAAPILLASLAPTPYFSGLNEHRRQYRVGDVFEHRVIDRAGRSTRTQTMRVTAVDPAADRVEFNDGEYLSDLMGNITGNPRGAMSTPRQFYPSELVVGRKWRTEFRQARTSGMLYHFSYDLKVAAKETITVPAGTFEAWRIEASGFNVGLSAHIKRTIWVAPGVDADIAHETFVRLRNGQIEQDDRQELVAYPHR